MLLSVLFYVSVTFSLLLSELYSVLHFIPVVFCLLLHACYLMAVLLSG